MLRPESRPLRVLAAGAIIVGIGGYALNDGGMPNKASLATEQKPSTDPYDGEEVLVYAPDPLTVEEAIAHYVGMDRPRTNLTDTYVERVVDELTDQYEAQTGASADRPFPGNQNGSQWITIEG